MTRCAIIAAKRGNDVKRHILVFLALGASLVVSAPLPASVKPCRDKDGKVIRCSQPRQASPRCKDASGRFVACPGPDAGTSGTRSGPR